MGGEDARRHCSRHPAVAVTGMYYGRPRSDGVQATLTRVAVSKKIGSRTKKAEVVKCLYDRNTLCPRSIVDRRRSKRKRVMNVDYLGLCMPQVLSKLRVRLLVPYRRTRLTNATELRQLIVGHHEGADNVTEAPQKIHFALENLIFSAGQLIKIMEYGDIHQSP